VNSLQDWYSIGATSPDAIKPAARRTGWAYLNSIDIPVVGPPPAKITIGQVIMISLSRLQPGTQALSVSRFLGYCLLVLAANSFATEVKPLQPTQAQSVTTIDIIDKLDKRHYRDLPIDDKLSEAFLEKYLNTLDPARLYFLQADIDEFYKHKHQHDDYIKKGNLKPGFEIHHAYQKRVIDRLDWVLAQLEDPKVTFDFNGKDAVEMNREKSPWPRSREEADELWDKRLKLSVLNLKLAGKSVEEAKKTLQRRYKNQLHRTNQQNSQDVFETLINSFTVLYDPHTNYFSPRTSENFNINMSLQLEGIGAVLQSEDEHTKVVRLVAGGPADKQGQLKPADKIIGVGQGMDGEIVDVVGWRLDEVVDKIRGKKDTIVRLEVLTGDAAPKIIPIKRGTVKLEDQAAQSAIIEISDGERKRKVGVIDIPAFYHDFDAYRRGDQNFRSTTRDVANLLRELQDQNVEGIILDLRNNGGGSLQEATMLTDLFIDQGPVVQIREADGRVSQHNRSRSRALYRGPLVVMINRLSASASEIFAGAIQDYNRGIIVGSQSFGKGTVQLLSDLPEGQLKLTESKFYRVSGDSTQHRGIIPDIAMPMLIDHDEVGESAYDTALPWDQISPAKHGKYFDFSNILPTLDRLHRERSSKDPDIIQLQDQISLMQKNKARTRVSLNETERLKEKEDLEREQMTIENKRRTAKGLKPFANLKEYQDYVKQEEADAEKVAAEARKKINPDDDALLNEAGYILIDMVELMKSPQQQVANF
jgi:carboxyl-terminal processing protease